MSYSWSKVLLLLMLLSFASSARAQGGIRESRQSMDEYDRDINRMKNDAAAARDRRRSLFPQINDDFQRVQVIHNELVRMLKSEKSLDYDRLADLTGELKKRGARLRENLALPQGKETSDQAKRSDVIDDPQVRKDIVTLHDLVVSFIGSPLFKNLGVVDAKVIDQATDDLDKIIDLSDEIKRSAKLLDKKGAGPQVQP
jgi:hypothetical protein